MIHDIVLESRSYRSFNESIKIGKEDLETFIDTARLCPSACNFQPLKYRLVYEHDEVEELLALTHWAGFLPDVKLPPEGHHPTAFIVVCCDTTVTENVDSARFDAGIASQTIMLQACEAGMGGCIIGAFKPEEVSMHLLIPKKYKPIVLLALGIPDETVFICNVPPSGSTKYYRDKANLHYVPKRSLEDVIIE
ncbi:MAG: nitroreductase family protein [Clostridia bacterium]|nr:nitroreductase family protein [Clostridia bacterium]